MNITVHRYDKTETRCIGKFRTDGFECYSLEDAEREEKIMHHTACPVGTYEVVVNYSNRFKKMLPLLLQTPGFTGVRIHSGNTDADTSGCILIGLGRSFDSVIQSRSAMNQFMGILMKAIKKEKVYIEIS